MWLPFWFRQHLSFSPSVFLWRAAPCNFWLGSHTQHSSRVFRPNKSFLTLRAWRSLPLMTATTLLCGKLILKFALSSVSCEKFRADSQHDPPWLSVARVMVRKVNSAVWRHSGRSGGGGFCMVVEVFSTTHAHRWLAWGRERGGASGRR